MEEDNRIWLQKLNEGIVGYSFNNLPLDDEAFARSEWNKYFVTNPYGFVGERSIYVRNDASREDVLKCLSAVITCIEKANLQDVLDDWKFERRYLELVSFSNAPSEIKAEQREYSSELLSLFKGHKELINDLVVKSDDEIAKQIKKWATQKDKFGKPLIENPGNNLKSAFAKHLKRDGIISTSVSVFRHKL